MSSGGCAASAGHHAAASSPNRAGQRKECSSYIAFLCVGVGSYGEKDVIEVGGVNRQVIDCNRFIVEPVEHGPQGPDAAVGRDLERELVVVARHLANGAGSRFEPVRVGELQADVAAGDAAFELVGGSLGNQLPPIENRDPGGELGRLVQVLRGEPARDATGPEVADDLPHRVAAARVQAGGRLVEGGSA